MEAKKSNEEIEYSVIIPVFNEKGNVLILFDEIKAVMQSLGKRYEVIFVDDHSTDGTFDDLLSLKGVTLMRFRKNFGQSAALDCGIKHAKGKIIITMDGDLQNDPKDITLLLKKLDEGYDAVSGWRHNRKDSFSKKLFSKISRYLRNFVIRDHLHDSGCSLKAYKKECFKDFNLRGEMHRYIAELLAIKGFRIGEIKVNHRERVNGKTKYDFKRVIKGFLDLFLVWFWQKYSSRPLHLFGTVGVMISIIGFIALIFSFYLKIFRHVDLSDTFLPTMGIFMILIGIQMFIAGIMTDLLVRTHNRSRAQYSVADVIKLEEDNYENIDVEL